LISGKNTRTPTGRELAAIVTLIALKLTSLITGLRIHKREEGMDLNAAKGASHGESAL
jgi:ammonia channel protein AmtB